MDIEKYLDRLNYSGSLKPTLQVLSELQKAHLLNIPFENLDIHYGIPIVLDTDRLFEKIVLHQRGGFCYELNGLFYELLLALGFSVKRISARVFDKTKGYGPEYDHLAIMAVIEGMAYLTDVGFGEFSFAPLKMEMEIIQKDARGDFIIREYENDYFLVSKAENSILQPQYIFKTTARELDEFNDMCLYHQTSPASHFTQNVLMTRPTEEGRITISRDTLKIKHAHSIQETPLENEGDFRRMLWKYFAIEMTMDDKAGGKK